MRTTIVAGFVVSIIFTFLSLVHFYWAFSGDGMMDYVIPEVNDEKVFKPSRMMTFVIALSLLSFAFIILGHIGVFELFVLKPVFKYGSWLISCIFSARAIGDFNLVGFFKKVKETKFAVWDSRVYSPLCLIIAILTSLVIFTNMP
jgi:hypothetical protein